MASASSSPSRAMAKALPASFGTSLSCSTAGGAEHEAEDDRFGHVARQVAELQEGNEELDDADEDAEEEDGLLPFRGVSIEAEAGDGTEDDERDGVGRAVDEMPGRAEQRAE